MLNLKTYPSKEVKKTDTETVAFGTHLRFISKYTFMRIQATGRSGTKGAHETCRLTVTLCFSS